MKRRNFHIDDPRMQALTHVADAENTSVSDLVREGIDRVIQDRLARPSDRAQLRADLDAFLSQHAGGGPTRSAEEIEDLVSEVTVA